MYERALFHFAKDLCCLLAKSKLSWIVLLQSHRIVRAVRKKQLYSVKGSEMGMPSLPKYLQLDLEWEQKRALSRIFPRVPYCEALKLAQIEAIRDHQNHLTKKLSQSVVNDPSNKLHALLPTRCNVGYNLRRERRFAQPLFRTKRFADSFLNRCVSEEMYS